MTLKAWIGPGGKICTTAEGKIILCETSPCGVSTSCCPDDLISKALTLSWPNSTGGLVEGSSGSIPLTYDGTSWVYTGTIPGGAGDCITTVYFQCLGVFEVTSTMGSGGSTITTVSCSPYLGTADNDIDVGCLTMLDATVTA